MSSNPKKKNQELTDIEVNDVGFLRIFFGMIKTRILGLPDPLYEKVVLLKRVKKQLKRINISGINFSKERLKPEFGQILFELYRYFYSFRKVVNLSKPQQMKNFLEFLILEVSSEKQKESMGQLLSSEHILKLMASDGPKDASKKLKSLYKEFSRSFTNEQKAKVNHLYSLAYSFNQFLRFDFYVLLKKFSPELKEDNISSPPRFREVEFRQVSDLLKDFTDHLYMLNFEANYYTLLEEYGKFIGSDIIPKEDFLKFFKLLHRLAKTNFMIYLVQFVAQDVFFRPINSYNDQNSFSEFMKNLAFDINELQAKVTRELKFQRVNGILKELFGKSDFMELTAYNEEQNEYLKKNNVGEFFYVDALNTLKKFMMEKYNTYLRTNLYTLIIKASFVSPEFREEFNSAYYRGNEILEQILEFERKMKGKDGWDRIQNLVRGRSRDASLPLLARKYVGQINIEAQTIIKNFIDIGNKLKSKLKVLVNDYNKGTKRTVSDIKKFAGTNTAQIMRSLAMGFNDLNKMMSYFGIVLKDSE